MKKMPIFNTRRFKKDCSIIQLFETWEIVWYKSKKVTYLQKQERDFSLTAKFDEMSSFHCGLGEKDSVVSDYADRKAVQTSKSRHLQTKMYTLWISPFWNCKTRLNSTEWKMKNLEMWNLADGINFFLTNVSPYLALNSSNLDPSTILAITSLTSNVFLRSSPTIPYKSSTGWDGGSTSAIVTFGFYLGWDN